MSEPVGFRWSRRELLRRGVITGAAVGAVPWLVTACSDGDETSVTNDAGDADSGSSPSSSSSPTTQATAGVGTITWALPFGAQTLDIVSGFDDATVHCLANVLGGLLVFDDDLELQPNLAESWEQPDPLTYRYVLRPDLKFSDGSPLTADDVVFSLTRSSGETSAVVSFFGNVDSISAEDALTVVVKLKKADALFKYVAAHPAGWVVSKAFAEQEGDGFGQGDTPTLGAAPYRITRFVPSELLELERNPNWWGEAPAVESVVIRFITENATRLLAVRDGSVDGTFQVPLEEARSWEDLDSATLVEAPGPYFAGVAYNTTMAPFDDVHVRRAVTLATNSQGIVEGLLTGHAETAIGGNSAMPMLWSAHSLAPDQARALMSDELTQYPFDLEAARGELAQSAVPDGFTFHLDFPDSYARLGRAFQIMQQDLAEIGITLTIGEVTFDNYIAAVFNHEIPPALAVLGIADYPDPMNLLYLLYFSEFATANAFNLSNYKNAQVDEQILANLATTDDAERLELATSICRTISDDMPLNALWWENSIAAVSNNLRLTSFNGFYFLQPWATRLVAA